MYPAKSKERVRTSPRRGAQAQPKDAVLSAMLMQIGICLALLALAYAVKLSWKSAYEPARSAVGDMLGQELDITFAKEALGSLDIKLPEHIDTELAGYIERYLPKGDEQSVSAGEAQSSASTQENAGEATDSEDAAVSDEAEKYGEAWLSEGVPAASPYSIQPYGEPSTADETADTPPPYDDGQLVGQGGGFNLVSKVQEKERQEAPKTAFLSPFFISDKPELPVKHGTLTGNFGYRIHPITGRGDFHTGVDIAAQEGAAVAAVLDGIVTEVGTSDVYGNYIVVRHGKGLETAYCHCSKITAPVGAAVRARETIARVGSTGASTGSHVHLEFRINGLCANPAWVYDEF